MFVGDEFSRLKLPWIGTAFQNLFILFYKKNRYSQIRLKRLSSQTFHNKNLLNNNIMCGHLFISLNFFFLTFYN